jgi:large subunit ribosomal protein L19
MSIISKRRRGAKVSRRNQVIEDFEKPFMVQKRTPFNVGDTIRVHLRIVEEEGQKERIQIFTGTVIAKKGQGLSQTFSVYRNAYGCSMERIFLLHSPKISKIEVIRSGKTVRSKLYYLRGVSGKKAKLEERYGAILGEEEGVSAEGAVQASPQTPPTQA